MQLPSKAIKILGIESSCDETSASIVTSDKQILSLITESQIKELEKYGGVVPEVSARAHLNLIESVIARALAQAKLSSLNEVDAIAATAGPGLIGGVIVGTMAAKTLASIYNKPYIAINHLEGHALAARLEADISYPYLLLLVSGGHCQFYSIEQFGAYQILGGTIDDSIGEALDKTGRLLGFSYPAGPAIEQAALKGDPNRFSLPKPLIHSEDCNFSFSGLKTSARQKIESLKEKDNLSPKIIQDFCASLQKTLSKVLTIKTARAMHIFKEKHQNTKANFVLSGGVAANHYFRNALQGLADKNSFAFHAPPIHLCTDNAAMIAWAGIEHFLAGKKSPLNFAPRPRWPLSEI